MDLGFSVDVLDTSKRVFIFSHEDGSIKVNRMESKQKKIGLVERIVTIRKIVELKKLVVIQDKIRSALSNEIGKNIIEINRLRESISEEKAQFCLDMTSA